MNRHFNGRMLNIFSDAGNKIYSLQEVWLMTDKETQYLDYYSFKRINEFKKIAEHEKISIQEAKNRYTSIADYIGKKIGITESEAKDIYIKLLDDIASIQYISTLFNEERKEGFGDLKTFYNWYIAQSRTCYYCGIEEAKINWLFNNVENFKNSKRGKQRGHHLEIDKKDPRGTYSEDNCVLSCYFCNNDKSDIFIGDDYKQSLEAGRKKYLEEIYSKKAL